MPKKPNDGGDNDPEDRGFNNPNLEFSVKFKNKVKNAQYEMIVTIQSEGKLKDGFFKQYKVKRNLTEFQDLHATLLATYQQEKLFKQYNIYQYSSLSPDSNTEPLESFVNSMIQKNKKLGYEGAYIFDQTVQHFLQIEDPQVL